MSGIIIPTLLYKDAPTAIDWLVDAFGFEKHLVVPGPGDTIAHAQLRLGTGMIMLGSEKQDGFGKLMSAPDEGQGVTQAIFVVVADPDAVHDRALSQGAEILMPLTDQEYGGRDFTCRDLEGHIWSFGTYDPWAHQPA